MLFRSPQNPKTPSLSNINCQKKKIILILNLFLMSDLAASSDNLFYPNLDSNDSYPSSIEKDSLIMNIATVNIRSIKNKMGYVQKLLIEDDLDILILSESRHNSEI